MLRRPIALVLERGRHRALGHRCAVLVRLYAAPVLRRAELAKLLRYRRHVRFEHLRCLTHLHEGVVPVWLLINAHLLLDAVGDDLKVDRRHLLRSHLVANELGYLLIREGLGDVLAFDLEYFLLFQIQGVEYFRLSHEAAILCVVGDL